VRESEQDVACVLYGASSAADAADAAKLR